MCSTLHNQSHDLHYYESESDPMHQLDLDLARLGLDIQEDKRGHVTYASLKVIALIGAWTSTVLLV